MKFLDSLRQLIRVATPTDAECKAALAAAAAESAPTPTSACWAILAAGRLYATAGLEECRKTLPESAKVQILLGAGMAKFFEQSRGETFTVEGFVAAITGFDAQSVFAISNEFSEKLLQISQQSKSLTGALNSFTPDPARPN